MAQVNEENLPAYNRCALYALGAAYLNLISQLTTVPAFCQHIHEVGVIRGPRAQWALERCLWKKCGRAKDPLSSAYEHRGLIPAPSVLRKACDLCSYNHSEESNFIGVRGRNGDVIQMVPN